MFGLNQTLEIAAENHIIKTNENLYTYTKMKEKRKWNCKGKRCIMKICVSVYPLSLRIYSPRGIIIIIVTNDKDNMK